MLHKAVAKNISDLQLFTPSLFTQTHPFILPSFLLPLLALFCLDRGSTAARFEARYVRFQFGSTSPNGQTSPKHGRCMQNGLLGHTGNGGCEEMLTGSCTRCAQQRRWGKSQRWWKRSLLCLALLNILNYIICAAVSDI